MERALRDALEHLCDGGEIVGVDAFQFRSDPTFVTAIRFWFKQYMVTFLANTEDEVTAALGTVAIEDEGSWVDLAMKPGWSECVGSMVTWAWVMTNQNRYTDAVRIEFALPNDRGSRIVEFVVIASAFRFFTANEF